MTKEISELDREYERSATDKRRQQREHLASCFRGRPEDGAKPSGPIMATATADDARTTVVAAVVTKQASDGKHDAAAPLQQLQIHQRAREDSPL